MKRLIYLVIFFVLSIFVILWIDFELLPHISTSKNFDKINNLFHAIFLAYITSFIFYFIIVFLKEQNDKKNLKKFLNEKISEINRNVKDFISQIETINEVKFQDEYPTRQELDEKFKNLDLSSYIKSKRIYPISYENYFKEHAKIVQSKLDRILIHLPYLETRFIDKINQVYDCQFFSTTIIIANSVEVDQCIEEGLFKKTGIRYSGVKFATTYPEHIISYLDNIKELNKYSP